MWRQNHAPRFEDTGTPKNHVPPSSAVLAAVAAIHEAVGERFPVVPIRWLRTYYYDSEPFSERKIDPHGVHHDFASGEAYANSMRLLEELRRADHMAVRLGKTKFSDWKIGKGNRYSPVFRQKGVDMKIGLDIAWMATKRIVDILILVTNYTDFVAPMKLARTEGVVVGIYCITTKPASLLNEHADVVITARISRT
ncbi:MAG: NYN domain-containing protein [Candidatus Kapaibacterium sp.]